MNITLLRSFIVVAETLNYGKAAVLLHLSQPALTRQIQKLEESLGGELFSRDRHGARLTALGKGFITDAKTLVTEADQLRERARRMAKGEIGELRIGFGFWAIDIVTAAVTQFRQRYPDVRIQLVDCSSAAQRSGLRENRLDVAFMRLTEGEEFAQLELSRESLSLVLPADSTFEKSQLTADYLSRQRLVMISPERASDFYRCTMAWLAELGVRPNVVQEAHEFYSLQALVASGQGIALMPASMEKLSISGVKVRFVSLEESVWSQGVATRRGETSPAVSQFLALLPAVGAKPDSNGLLKL